MSRTIFTRVAMAATLTLGALTFAMPAQAQTGTLDFSGGRVDLEDQPGSGGVNLLVDFLAGSPRVIGGPTPGQFVVDNAEGDFAAASFGDQGTISDLVVGPGGVIGLPVANFINVSGFTFTLDNTQATEGQVVFGTIGVSQSGSSSFATFSFTGRVTGNGLTNNPFVGIITTQFANQTPTQVFQTINSGGRVRASFSGQLALTAVPEPSTYALLASGIGALALVARRRRTQA